MNTRPLVITLFAVLLAGCGQVAKGGGVLVRNFGDDAALIASRNGGKIARTAQRYVAEQAQWSDDAALYWVRRYGDDALLASQSLDDSALILLYRSGRLSPVQGELVTLLREDAKLSESQSLLFLQTVCAVADFVDYYGVYPSQSSAQDYAEKVAAESGTPLASLTDFGEAAVNLAEEVIESDGNYSRQEMAGFLFKGLCLVSDGAGN
jgi:hypothetical protein